MIIENIKNVRQFNLLMSALFMLMMLSLVLRQYYNIRSYYFLTGFSILALVLPVALFLMKPAYFHCQIQGNRLVIRYYRLLVNIFKMQQNTRTIEISRNEFKDYELNRYNYGLTQELVLNVRAKGQIFPYPPVSISLLNKKDKQELLAALEEFSSK